MRPSSRVSVRQQAGPHRRRWRATPPSTVGPHHHLAEVYGASVPKDTVSRTTDRVLMDLQIVVFSAAAHVSSAAAGTLGSSSSAHSPRLHATRRSLRPIGRTLDRRPSDQGVTSGGVPCDGRARPDRRRMVITRGDPTIDASNALRSKYQHVRGGRNGPRDSVKTRAGSAEDKRAAHLSASRKARAPAATLARAAEGFAHSVCSGAALPLMPSSAGLTRRTQRRPGQDRRRARLRLWWDRRRPDGAVSRCVESGDAAAPGLLGHAVGGIRRSSSSVIIPWMNAQAARARAGEPVAVSNGAAVRASSPGGSRSRGSGPAVINR